MRRFRGWFLAGALASVQVAAQALPEKAVAWNCWYDGDTSLLCELARADGRATDANAAPVSSRLPALVHAIARAPASLRGTRVAIPMYTIPFETSSMAYLARSVMCGVRKDCEVRFGTAAQIAELQLFEDD